MLYSGIAYCAILMMLVKVIKIFNSAAVGGSEVIFRLC